MLPLRTLTLLLLAPACAAPSPVDEFPESHDFDVTTEVIDEEPTVIRISWETDAPGPSWVEFGTGDPLGATSVEENGTTRHEFRLVGLPAETEVFFRAVSVVDGEELATTGSEWTLEFPSDVPGLDLGGIDPTATASNPYVLGAVFEMTTGIFVADRAGRLLWFHELDQGVNAPKIELLEGSSKAFAMITPMTFGTRGAEIRTFSIADGTMDSTPLTGGAHHAFTRLPDGSIAYIRADIREWEDWNGDLVQVAGDAITIRSPDGATWDLFSTWDWLEPTYNDYWNDTYFGSAHNWTHANALDYDPNTDTLLLSLRDLGCAVEVDVGTGDAVRWFGTDEGYRFASGSRHFSYQHEVGWSPTGTLLASTTVDGVTLGVEYEVDEDARLLREVWSYGEDLGFNAAVHGGIQALDNGNRLLNWGAKPAIREITPDGDVAWDLSLEKVGITTLVPLNGFYDP